MHVHVVFVVVSVSSSIAIIIIIVVVVVVIMRWTDTLLADQRLVHIGGHVIVGFLLG